VEEDDMATNDALSRRELLGTAKAAGLAALGVALLPAVAHADIDDYPALKKGRDLLLDARAALEKGDDKFGGHKKEAIKLIGAALDEIKAAVKFAG
jgi:hypothetical protein